MDKTAEQTDAGKSSSTCGVDMATVQISRRQN